MNQFNFTVDNSINSAILRVIQDELGDISVQITASNNKKYLITLPENIEITSAQSSKIKKGIKTIFSSNDKIILFEDTE